MDRVNLSFEEYGQGVPVIFLHGFPFNRTIWDGLVPLLQKRARLILPDLRGFGQTPPTRGVYGMRLLADDVLGLMDDLQIEKAALVGHSMGGYVCLAFARAHPGRLAGLGLVATQAAADAPERRQERLKLASRIARRGVKILAENMPTRLTAHASWNEPLRELIARTPAQAAAGALRGMAEREDAYDSLAQIHVPALVLAGVEDQIIPLERARLMAQMLPKGWLVELPGAGHMPMLEEPEQTAEALRELIHCAEAGLK